MVCHGFDRQDQVYVTAGDGGAWHTVELGLVGILSDGQTAAVLDDLEPGRAVGAGAGEDDPDGPWAVGAGEGAQEVVDGGANPLIFGWC